MSSNERPAAELTGELILEDFLQSHATDYNATGYNVLPTVRRDKQPAVEHWRWWQFDRQEPHDVGQMFQPNDQRNLGLIYGQPSHNIYVIDCESPECFAELSQAVRATVGVTATSQTGRGGHILLRSSMPVIPAKYNGYEIRGQGSYILVPPSIHPTSAVYSFTSASIRTILADSLPFVDLQFTRPLWIPRLARQI